MRDRESIFSIWKSRILASEELTAEIAQVVDLSQAKIKMHQEGLLISVAYRGFAGRLWVTKKKYAFATLWIFSFLYNGKQRRRLGLSAASIPHLFKLMDMIEKSRDEGNDNE